MTIRHLAHDLLLAAMLAPAMARSDEYSGLAGPMGRLPESGVAPAQPALGTYPSLPGPPLAPSPTVRPEQWPGGPSPAEPPVATPWPPAPEGVPRSEALGAAEPCEGAQILARVGTEVILAAEVRATAVYSVLAEVHRRKLEPTPEELRELVDQTWLGYLSYAVEAKLLYLDGRRDIPTEALADLDKRITTIFYEDPSGAKQLKEFTKTDTMERLQQRLEALGTSLDWQKRLFGERVLSQQAIAKSVERGGPITHEEMLTYYRDNLADFEHAARARWQQLTVRASRYPDPRQARAALAEMGNRIVDGADFAEIAREGSDGPTAAAGGLRDWTTQGSLVSKELDRALFELPVGSLSPILQDEQGFHIVRVLQREGASRTPFAEVQESIRQKVQEQRFRQGLKEYLARLKRQTPVWTIRDTRPGQGEASGEQPRVGARAGANY